jgi:hypothetical protein
VEVPRRSGQSKKEWWFRHSSSGSTYKLKITQTDLGGHIWELGSHQSKLSGSSGIPLPASKFGKDWNIYFDSKSHSTDGQDHSTRHALNSAFMTEIEDCEPAEECPIPEVIKLIKCDDQHTSKPTYIIVTKDAKKYKANRISNLDSDGKPCYYIDGVMKPNITRDITFNKENTLDFPNFDGEDAAAILKNIEKCDVDWSKRSQGKNDMQGSCDCCELEQKASAGDKEAKEKYDKECCLDLEKSTLGSTNIKVDHKCIPEPKPAKGKEWCPEWEKNPTSNYCYKGNFTLAHADNAPLIEIDISGHSDLISSGNKLRKEQASSDQSLRSYKIIGIERGGRDTALQPGLPLGYSGTASISGGVVGSKDPKENLRLDFKTVAADGTQGSGPDDTSDYYRVATYPYGEFGFPIKLQNFSLSDNKISYNDPEFSTFMSGVRSTYTKFHGEERNYNGHTTGDANSYHIDILVRMKIECDESTNEDKSACFYYDFKVPFLFRLAMPCFPPETPTETTTPSASATCSATNSLNCDEEPLDGYWLVPDSEKADSPRKFTTDIRREPTEEKPGLELVWAKELEGWKFTSSDATSEGGTTAEKKAILTKDKGTSAHLIKMEGWEEQNIKYVQAYQCNDSDNPDLKKTCYFYQPKDIEVVRWNPYVWDETRCIKHQGGKEWDFYNFMIRPNLNEGVGTSNHLLGYKYTAQLLFPGEVPAAEGGGEDEKTFALLPNTHAELKGLLRTADVKRMITTTDHGLRGAAALYHSAAGPWDESTPPEEGQPGQSRAGIAFPFDTVGPRRGMADSFKDSKVAAMVHYPAKEGGEASIKVTYYSSVAYNPTAGSINWKDAKEASKESMEINWGANGQFSANRAKGSITFKETNVNGMSVFWAQVPAQYKVNGSMVNTTSNIFLVYDDINGVWAMIHMTNELWKQRQWCIFGDALKSFATSTWSIPLEKLAYAQHDETKFKVHQRRAKKGEEAGVENCLLIRDLHTVTSAASGQAIAPTADIFKKIHPMDILFWAQMATHVEAGTNFVPEFGAVIKKGQQMAKIVQTGTFSFTAWHGDSHGGAAPPCRVIDYLTPYQKNFAVTPDGTLAKDHEDWDEEVFAGNLGTLLVTNNKWPFDIDNYPEKQSFLSDCCGKKDGPPPQYECPFPLRNNKKEKKEEDKCNEDSNHDGGSSFKYSFQGVWAVAHRIGEGVDENGEPIDGQGERGDEITRGAYVYKQLLSLREEYLPGGYGDKTWGGSVEDQTSQFWGNVGDGEVKSEVWDGLNDSDGKCTGEQ